MRDHRITAESDGRNELKNGARGSRVGVSKHASIAVVNVGDPPTISMIGRDPAMACELPHGVGNCRWVRTRHREQLTHQPVPRFSGTPGNPCLESIPAPRSTSGSATRRRRALSRVPPSGNSPRLKPTHARRSGSRNARRRRSFRSDDIPLSITKPLQPLRQFGSRLGAGVSAHRRSALATRFSVESWRWVFPKFGLRPILI